MIDVTKTNRFRMHKAGAVTITRRATYTYVRAKSNKKVIGKHTLWYGTENPNIVADYPTGMKPMGISVCDVRKGHWFWCCTCGAVEIPEELACQILSAYSDNIGVE